MDTRSNSRANTCVKSQLLREGMYLLDKKPMRVLPGVAVNHSNCSDRMASCRRQFIQISALSAFDGSVVDYRGVNGWRRIRVRFRRGSLRKNRFLGSTARLRHCTKVFYPSASFSFLIEKRHLQIAGKFWFLQIEQPAAKLTCLLGECSSQTKCWWVSFYSNRGLRYSRSESGKMV